MTNRERFLAFAGFEPVDRIPRTAGYTEHLYEQLKRRYGADPYQHFAMDNGHGCGLTARTVPEGFTWPDYSVYQNTSALCGTPGASRNSSATPL
jgi:hypothetical protein